MIRAECTTCGAIGSWPIADTDLAAERVRLHPAECGLGDDMDLDLSWRAPEATVEPSGAPGEVVVVTSLALSLGAHEAVTFVGAERVGVAS